MENILTAMFEEEEAEEMAAWCAVRPPTVITEMFMKNSRCGSMPGRLPNKPRNWLARHERLCEQYFTSVPPPVYSDDDFRRRFRMSKRVFTRLLAAVEGHDRYFTQRRDCTGKLGASPLIKVTAAVRVLAYGVAADELDENLELAESTVLESLRRFCAAVNAVFSHEYVREPTEEDTARILRVYDKHGWPGCIGCIDCMHWQWKNCPTALAGQFRGPKSKHPTVVLEAVADAELWLWHVSFGGPGSLNDLNILDRSPLFDRVAQGTAPEVGYVVNGTEYKMAYYLADGIYPNWPVFVKSVEGGGITTKQQLYTKMQEARRKDVERAFGVVQARFRIIQQPFRLLSLEDMGDIMRCCVTIHNMVVEDERHLSDRDRFQFLLDDLQQDPRILARIGHTQFAVRRPAPGEAVSGVEEVHCNLERIQRQSEHVRLQASLIEHIWSAYGTAIA
eukprot:GHVU01032317.1.p1 GENE.GHVU01032317.1~~GHVU01032317.1.p1  ORF type:complete len:448 (+),score=58.83 GHVU01032317.1:216-1559(+)